VQTAWPGKASGQRGLQNTFTLAEKLPGMRQSQALDEILGRDGSPIREEAVKVELTQAGLPGQYGQVGLVGMAFIQKADHAGHAVIIVHAHIMA